MEFHLESSSGTPPYLQVARQVRNALRLGVLVVGDQLPTVREVVGQLAINPNTVLKAYRELEREGLVAARPGLGTFVAAVPDGPSLAEHEELLAALAAWVRRAYAAGLDPNDIGVMFSEALRPNLRAVDKETA